MTKDVYSWPIEPDFQPFSDGAEGDRITRARPENLPLPAWCDHYASELDRDDEIIYTRRVSDWLEIRQTERVALSCEGVEWWRYGPELYLQLVSEEQGRKIWVRMPLADVDELINDLQQAKELLQADQSQPLSG